MPSPPAVEPIADPTACAPETVGSAAPGPLLATAPAVAPAPGALTDVAGIAVGHAELAGRPSGCTVVLCPEGATGGVAVRGGAPGTRETDLLAPGTLVSQVHAVLLTGGSAFGLDAAGGVMRWLEARGHGLAVQPSNQVASAGPPMREPIHPTIRVPIRVPIVPAAVLFDLWLGDPSLRPDALTGHAACEAASTAPPAQGNVGAGAGATVGKLFGMAHAMKGGVGTASLRRGGITVGALVAVNALGDVRAADGTILAGARSADGRGWRDSTAALCADPNDPSDASDVTDAGDASDVTDAGDASDVSVPTDQSDQSDQSDPQSPREGFTGAAPGTATTIGVVATDAVLDKAQANRLAALAHHGLSRAISPLTLADGDTLFVLATGRSGRVPDAATFNALGACAAEVVAAAIRNGVLAARGWPGLPAARDLVPVAEAKRTAEAAGAVDAEQTTAAADAADAADTADTAAADAIAVMPGR